MIVVIALLSVIPNGRLVFSPVAFGVSLLVALFPLAVVLIHNFSDPFLMPGDFLNPFGFALLLLIFGPFATFAASEFLVTPKKRRRGLEPPARPAQPNEE